MNPSPGTSDTHDALRDAALDYAQRGWSVIPLKPRDKRPLVAWEAYQTQRASVEQVREWWDQYPGANVGLVTGAISGIVVLDVDGPDGEASLAGKDIPVTPSVATGKGRHIYLAHPGGTIKNFARKLPGLDLRGDGGYVVAPLSVHPSGRVYTWIDGPDVPLAEMPAWLLELVRPTEPQRPAPRPAVQQVDREAAYAQRALDAELDAVARAPEGTRNDTLNRAAFNLGQLVAAGLLDRGDVEDQLVHTAVANGLTVREALATVRSGLAAGERQPRTIPDRPLVRGSSHRVAEEPQGAGATDQVPLAPKNPLTQDFQAALAWLGYTFRYNLMTDTVEAHHGGVVEDLTDPVAAHICMQMWDLGYKNPGVIERVILATANENSYHPIRDYLEGLAWDGTPRISLLATYFRDDHGLATDRNGRRMSVFSLYLRRWLVGAVARVLGAEQNVMLVLAGPQGIGKSHFCKWLASGVDRRYYLEEPAYPDKRDSIVHLVDTFIWEVGELGATTKRADVEALKQFITKPYVSRRPPYGKRHVNRQAVAALIGTVNGDGGGFLNDPTGSRRFMTVQLREIKRGYDEDIPIDQLWAEAVHLYRNGEPWALEGPEAAIRDELNEAHQVPDAALALVQKYFIVDPEDTDSAMTLADVWAELARREAMGRNPTNADFARLGRALTSLGLRVERRRTPTGRERVYVGISPRPLD